MLPEKYINIFLCLKLHSQNKNALVHNLCSTLMGGNNVFFFWHQSIKHFIYFFFSNNNSDKMKTVDLEI